MVASEPSRAPDSNGCRDQAQVATFPEWNPKIFVIFKDEHSIEKTIPRVFGRKVDRAAMKAMAALEPDIRKALENCLARRQSAAKN